MAASTIVLRSCSSCAPCDGWRSWTEIDCEIFASSLTKESRTDAESKGNAACDDPLNRQRPLAACTCHWPAIQQTATFYEVVREGTDPWSLACAAMVSDNGAWSEIWSRRP